MTPRNLKRISRSDLLEMLLDLSRENDELKAQLAAVTEELEKKQLMFEKSGSLAEAVVQLNDVFGAAQAACDQYEMNVRERCRQLEKETYKKCKELLAGAREEWEWENYYAWLSEQTKVEDDGVDW